MVDASTLATFVVVVVGLFLVPGPAVLITTTRAIQGGRRTGIMTGLGIAAGDLVHTAAAAVGLSALIAASASAFFFVKIAGVVYLAWLGLRAILERPAATSVAPAPPLPARTAFLQGLFSEVLNPKTAMFFLAFLPQFVRPENGAPLAQFTLLGLIFVGLSALYTTALACAAAPIARLLARHSGVGRWQGKIVGGIYLALAARLAAQTR